MDLGLSQRVAVVTGGASNIGRAISHVLAAEGATVAILDRDEDMADRTAAEITASGGAAVRVRRRPHRHRRDAGRRRRRRTDLGPIAVLVNNVGWNGPAAFFLDLPPERWERAWQLNVLPTLNATRAVLAGMVERRGRVDRVDRQRRRLRRVPHGRLRADEGRRDGVHPDHRQGVRPLRDPRQHRVPRPRHPRARRHRRRQPVAGRHRLRREADHATWRRRPRCAGVRKRSTSPTSVAWLASDTARMLTGQVLSVSGGFDIHCPAGDAGERKDGGADMRHERQVELLRRLHGVEAPGPGPLAPARMHNPATRVHVARTLRRRDAGAVPRSAGARRA